MPIRANGKIIKNTQLSLSTLVICRACRNPMLNLILLTSFLKKSNPCKCRESYTSSGNFFSSPLFEIPTKIYIHWIFSIQNAKITSPLPPFAPLLLRSCRPRPCGLPAPPPAGLHAAPAPPPCRRVPAPAAPRAWLCAAGPVRCPCSRGPVRRRRPGRAPPPAPLATPPSEKKTIHFEKKLIRF
jgi:hypothetical protein